MGGILVLGAMYHFICNFHLSSFHTSVCKIPDIYLPIGSFSTNAKRC